MKCLNLACGATYIVDDSWVNVDFCQVSEEVIGHNLLEPLPFPANYFDLVYCSHFLEHIPRASVHKFLLESKRVLRPGGVIRLVLPDCEEMFSSFLSLRSEGLHDEADFLIVEIIDQCVRQWPGGELGGFYSQVRSMDSDRRAYWLQFLAFRNGEGLETLREPQALNALQSDRQCITGFDLSPHLFNLPRNMYRRLRIRIHRLGLRLLLPAFREQNVCFASVGERHMWLWDFYQLHETLVSVGFHSISRKTHLSSLSEEFPFVPLDSTVEGLPRKGKESMHVEAIK